MEILIKNNTCYIKEPFKANIVDGVLVTEVKTRNEVIATYNYAVKHNIAKYKAKNGNKVFTYNENSGTCPVISEEYSVNPHYVEQAFRKENSVAVDTNDTIKDSGKVTVEQLDKRVTIGGSTNTAGNKTNLKDFEVIANAIDTIQEGLEAIKKCLKK